ncbi:MAG TPA: hypothetical protein DHV74_02485 [Sulfitobacter sp.]|nr:hypothetical protein [Sulfitobacter sp.]HCI98505.1 hypothetical protein [Sulfitobacter sp.]
MLRLVIFIFIDFLKAHARVSILLITGLRLPTKQMLRNVDLICYTPISHLEEPMRRHEFVIESSGNELGRHIYRVLKPLTPDLVQEF